jgi:hypothetical protein
MTRRTIHLRPRYLLLLAAMLLTVAGSRAQATATVSEPYRQEVDVAVTYTAQHSNLVSNPTFWQQGGGAELSAQVWRGIGLSANIIGTNTGNAANSNVGLTMVTSTFGPRYTWRRPIGSKRSLAIFGQGLVGESHGFNSYFPESGGELSAYNSFALQIGGGIDVGLSRHLAIRAIQADWLRTEFPNGTTNVQNSFRIAAGVVLRFPQRRTGY